LFRTLAAQPGRAAIATNHKGTGQVALGRRAARFSHSYSVVLQLHFEFDEGSDIFVQIDLFSACDTAILSVWQQRSQVLGNPNSWAPNPYYPR
jgi:hypothetical protein